MKIVIQCASSKNVDKNSDSGFMKTSAGKRVMFVGDPSIAPYDSNCQYAKPDDPAGNGDSWRDRLRVCNKNYPKTRDNTNPHGLLPAGQLYKHKTYGDLVEKYGVENIYTLSAGWGLIPARFLTPNYDITYSSSAKGSNAYKRRRKEDVYDDFSLLPNSETIPVVFFGGKDYQQSFCNLTKGYRGERICFYNSINKPNMDGVTLKRYDTSTRTNWHYQCAQAFMDGRIALS